MNNLHTRFIEPLDVLILRGNKLFGDPGSYGEALIPPWPSVAAGAIRSRMLADDKVDITAFAKGNAPHDTLGTPTSPGTFTLTAFHLARQTTGGGHEPLMPPPADLSIVEDDEGKPTARRAVPTALAAGLASSAPLPLHPVLAETTRAKAASGYWLTESGWTLYLQGGLPKADELVKSAALWRIDERVGVGLSSDTRSAEDGKLFSTQAVAFKPDVGFMATVSGANPPESGLLRFGGDGRGAAIHAIEHHPPTPDYDAIIKTQHCRLVLTSPGVFVHGWLPNGARPDVRREDGAIRFDLHGVTGWLVCAAVPRAEIISGWDQAARDGKGHPKPAERVAPTGSVYWLELDPSVHAASLEQLQSVGLWHGHLDADSRRAEGFNRLALGCW